MPADASNAILAARPRRILLRLYLGLTASAVLAFAAMTCAQAWSMTHYAPATTRTTRLAELTLWGKVHLLVGGPTVRRQVNVRTPAALGFPYGTIRFRGAGGLQLEAWHIPATEGAQTVVMFPGYGASKDTLLGAAQEFAALGLNLWLVDPHGIGGSEGAVTSVGYHEAEDVAAAFRQARAADPQARVILYGTSMGAVAILRAVSEGWVEPESLILECPFDRFTTTIGNRFAWLGLPRFPFAPAVAAWVGLQQGFNGLAHNPVSYARRVHCPTLLLQGELDESVGRAAIRNVAAALGGQATFELIPNAGHTFLATRAPAPWRRSVRAFLGHPVGP